MPSYTYRAADPHGRIVAGELECESEAEVLRALEQRSLTAVQMRRAAATRADGTSDADRTTRLRISLTQKLQFTRQLKVMLAAGVTLLSTLGLLRQKARRDYKALLDRIATDIQRGATLSDALARHPRTFDPFYLGVIRAGEAAGLQTESLDELVAHYERRAGLQRELIGALTYPCIVLLVLIGACVVMLTCVVPQFESLFAAAQSQLPLPTRVLIGASGVVTGYPVTIVAVFLALAVGACTALPLPGVQAALGRAAAHLPLIGRLLHLHTVVQFCRMTALLERSGLPILETFRVVEGMLMPGAVKHLVGDIRRQVVAGNSIAGAIAGTNVLPDLVEQMIVVGESAGKIDTTLLAAADHFEAETRIRVKQLTVALEPLLTLLVSALVMGIALAIFLPMWELHTVLLKK